MMLDQLLMIAHQILPNSAATIDAVIRTGDIPPMGCHVVFQLVFKRLELKNFFSQLIEKMKKIHIRHNNIVLDIHDKGIDKLQMINILAGDQAIIEIKPYSVDILDKEKLIRCGQGGQRPHGEHTEKSAHAAKPGLSRPQFRFPFPWGIICLL